MEALTNTSMRVTNAVGLEINIEKTKFILLAYHQKVGQNRNMKVANRLFENVSQLKNLCTTVTNQNLI
jgi:hypothetical protein